MEKIVKVGELCIYFSTRNDGTLSGYFYIPIKKEEGSGYDILRVEGDTLVLNSASSKKWKPN